MNLRIKQRMRALELLFKYYNSCSDKNKVIFKSHNAYFINNKNKTRVFTAYKCANSGYSNAHLIQCAKIAASEELASRKVVC